MVSTEVSGSLIVREGKILMVEDESGWNIPISRREEGELSAETAERAAEEHTGCDSEAVKYRKEMKKKFDLEGESLRLQPFSVEIEGEPEEAEWKNTSELESNDLADPVREIAGQIADRF